MKASSAVSSFFLHLGCLVVRKSWRETSALCLRYLKTFLASSCFAGLLGHSGAGPVTFQVRGAVGLGNRQELGRGVEQGCIFCRHSHNSVFAEPENFLKLQLLCWPPRTLSSWSCHLPGQRSCWAGKWAGAGQACGAGVHFLSLLSQFCCGYLTIVRKFEIL